MKYDYLIVGAGLFGSVFAHEIAQKGFKCLIIEKRKHIGGNVYTEIIEGINVHKYGAHIFHTSNQEIWQYVNSFIEFNHFINSPIANFKDKLYNLPFNMNTFYQLWGVHTPEQARMQIDEQIKRYKHLETPQNLEEQALAVAGKDIYETLIKGYTEKQWGRPANKIPAFIIQRLPFRFTFNNNYFNDPYQGIPKGGYTKLIYKLLGGIEVKLNTDFFDHRYDFLRIAKKIVFTGKIDKFFDYKYGRLEYRSLYFENKLLDIPNFQGNAVINYTDKEIPYTRIIEHKHFEFGQQDKTLITYEYPHEFSKDNEPYYPINDDHNQKMYEKYKREGEKFPDVIFGGRLAEYKYYDMHKVIERAIKIAQNEIRTK